MLPVRWMNAAWVPSGALGLLNRLPLATSPAPLPGICVLVNVHGVAGLFGLYKKPPVAVVTSCDANPESRTLLVAVRRLTASMKAVLSAVLSGLLAFVPRNSMVWLPAVTVNLPVV